MFRAALPIIVVTVALALKALFHSPEQSCSAQSGHSIYVFAGHETTCQASR